MKIAKGKIAKHVLLKRYLRASVFLLGDGRSGTTWFSELVNFEGNYWEVFEPFHGREPLPIEGGRMYPLQSDLQGVVNSSVNLANYFRET